jgi:prepilin-type processing-associated H-X9-DG protein
MMNTADELLSDYMVTETGKTVQLSTATDVNAAMLTPLFISVQSARGAARRIQAMNNLKQIGLAMHNYHDVYKHFPSAVVYGIGNKDKDKKGGRVGHSWRVELLPFLEAAPLYTQYIFNEPWDSENNKKILAQMPAVFRDPNDDSKSTNSSYYALVGEGTVFSPKDGFKDGVRLRDITDGSSNTLAVVEAKRSIPWTKPEDIPFDPKKELPNLGGWNKGGYNALFCDGHVRFIADAIDKTMLKWLILRNDGHAVNINLPQPRRQPGVERPLPIREPTDSPASGGDSEASFGSEEGAKSVRPPSAVKPAPGFGESSE